MGIKEWFKERNDREFYLMTECPKAYWEYREKSAIAVWGTWNKMFDFMAIAIFSAALMTIFYYAFR